MIFHACWTQISQEWLGSKNVQVYMCAYMHTPSLCNQKRSRDRTGKEFWHREISCLSGEICMEVVLQKWGCKAQWGPWPFYPEFWYLYLHSKHPLQGHWLLGMWSCPHEAWEFHPYLSDSFTLIKVWFLRAVWHAISFLGHFSWSISVRKNRYTSCTKRKPTQAPGPSTLQVGVAERGTCRLAPTNMTQQCSTRLTLCPWVGSRPPPGSTGSIAQWE